MTGQITLENLQAEATKHALNLANDATSGKRYDAEHRKAGAGWFAEKPPEFPQMLEGKWPSSVRDDDEVRRAAHQHLLAVQRVETRNAGRLQALLWAVQTLRREGVPDLADELAKWTAKHYPRVALVMRNMGQGLEPRAIAIPATVDFVSMPLEWREELAR